MSRARIVHTAIVCIVAAPCAFAQTSIRMHTGAPLGSAGFGGTFGASGASIGDVDHDGVDDYAIGAIHGGDFGSGKVFVYSGATGAQIFALSGGPADDRFGTWIDGVGDVDLDGTVDLVVGAMNLVDQPNDVRVFSGSSHQAIWSKSGTQAGGAMWAVRGGGDMNLDGIPDVLATTFASFALGFRVVILRGQNGVNAGFVGPALGDFGKALDGGADLNGDGIPEILVGAPATSNSGRVYLYDGATRSELWHVDGATPNAKLGFDVSFGGDVDGDGIRDVAVLATGEYEPLDPNQYLGTVRVLSGATGQTTWLRYGREHEALFDAHIDFSRDLDGDTLSDVLVSSAREEGEEDPGWVPHFEGIARIFSGANGETRSALADPTFYPWEIGWNSFSTGDLNGDGLSDFVVTGGMSGSDSNSAAWVYGSVGNGGTVSYAGGPNPGTPEGCVGTIGSQCHLVPSLAPANLEFEGCFAPNGKAILYLDNGLTPPVTLLFIGTQPMQAILPGACALLVNPIQSIVLPSVVRFPVTFPAITPSGTLLLQSLSYDKQAAPPFGFECLQVSSSARVQVTFP